MQITGMTFWWNYNKTDPYICNFIATLFFWYQILILFCYFQEKRIQFETNLNSIKDKGKELIDKTKDKGHELLHRWEERSKDFIGNFLELFGRDGRLVGDFENINYLYFWFCLWFQMWVVDVVFQSQIFP